MSDDLVDNIALALDTGKRYMNLAPAGEGPGHLSCMLYSAAVCPYLASPGARRQNATTLAEEQIPRGDPRGAEGAVVGFDSYRWQIGRDGFEIFYGQPTEMLSYTDGADLIDELTAEIEREPEPTPQYPEYLLDDDSKAQKIAKAIITVGTSSPSDSAQRKERTRKNRRKAAKASRRNRR